MYVHKLHIKTYMFILCRCVLVYEWEEEFNRASGREEGEELLGSCEGDDVT